MEKQRLDKFLSNQTGLSRSEARSVIRATGLYVNGKSVFDPSFIIDASTAEVIFKGQRLKYKKYVYILMNKPKGVLSATNDKKQKTVLDLLPESFRNRKLAPVGRLDKETTGLLIITDDGEFSHNCISPSKNVKKVYEAELDGALTEQMITAFKEGITLADGTLCKSADLEILEENIARITITEGKYHQIKRMFGTQGLGVNELKRLTIGELKIPKGLLEGEYTEITVQEALKTIEP